MKAGRMALSELQTPCRGFTYVGLLILVAIFGVLAASTVSVGAVMQRRAQESELMYIGSQFQAAFRSYYEATPIGQRNYPMSLEDLVKDSRFPIARRHLRKIFADPLTGNVQWGIVQAPGGGIAGVYSLHEAKPIRTTNFSPEFVHFEGKVSYKEWVFGYAPLGIAAPQQPLAATNR